MSTENSRAALDFMVVDGKHILFTNPDGTATAMTGGYVAAILLMRAERIARNSTRVVGPRTQSESEYAREEVQALIQHGMDTTGLRTLAAYGWDDNIMSSKEYTNALVLLLKGGHLQEARIILPDDKKVVLPAELESVANVRRSAGSIPQGFVLYGNNAVSVWDETRRSIHPGAADSVIYRAHYRPSTDTLAEKVGLFERQFQEAR